MSKADYLSKYTSGPSKKKKKSRKNTAPSSIVVDVPIDIQPADEPEEEAEENETSPVQVELHTREFKGFKRIDNGTVVDPSTVSASIPGFTALTSSSHPPPTQQTIYRDLSGRIIDIDEKRQQVLEEKERASKTFTEIRLTEDEQHTQAKQSFKPKATSTIDDPMALFNPQSREFDLGIDNYKYNKGVNPVNRFGIKAGYFWDGIDRGNGFEELVIRNRNHQKLTKLDDRVEESYDMDYE